MQNKLVILSNYFIGELLSLSTESNACRERTATVEILCFHLKFKV